MIRRAALLDRPALIGLARQFHAAVPQFAALPFSAAQTARVAHVAITQGVALVLDLEGLRGALVALLQPAPFSEAVVAQEVAFFIEPAWRGRWAVPMIRAYEEAARAKGAVRVGLACLDDQTALVFERLGYTRAETIMARAV